MSFSFLNAQEKRTFISGKTVLDTIGINDVHIINQRNKIGTITNNSGFFNIYVKVGDSLYFSHLKYQKKLIIITEETLSTSDFIIRLNEGTVALNGFELKKQRSIFYQDPEITSYVGPIINAIKLKLPFANTAKEKDKSIINFRSGASISLNSLINSLNASDKREKQLKKMSAEDIQLKKIRKKFTDDFFITDLKIKKEYINQFLNDCIDKNIIQIFIKNNILNLTKTLIEESKLYPNKIIDEDLFLTNY